MATGERRQWAESMADSVRQVCGHLQGPLMKAALAAVGHDGEVFLTDLHDGFEGIGGNAPSGTWKPRAEPPTQPLHAILTDARERQDSGNVLLPKARNYGQPSSSRQIEGVSKSSDQQAV